MWLIYVVQEISKIILGHLNLKSQFRQRKRKKSLNLVILLLSINILLNNKIPATQASPITGYTRPSYLDERKMNEYRPHNTYIDRRKSFHEMSPGLEEDRHSPGYSYDRQPRYGATGTRYEDESLDSWMNSRNRFEVYQTRAERAAEMNTGGYSYRPTAGSYWHNDRPTSAYIPGSYKSRFDDNFLYRRSAFDVERPGIL